METLKQDSEIIESSSKQIENTLESIKRKNKTYDVLHSENGLSIVTVHKAPFKPKTRYKRPARPYDGPPTEKNPLMLYKDFAKTLKR